MPFNFKIFYAFILGISFHQAIPKSPAWLPLFIQKLWNAQAWKTTCQSLENNEQYKELKTTLGSSIEKLVLPPSVVECLLQEDKVFLASQYQTPLNARYTIDQLETQIKLNNFLIQENFKHFEPAQKLYLSEINGNLELIVSNEKNISNNLFVGSLTKRIHLTSEETDELLKFIEKTGYVFSKHMAEGKETHCLHNWRGLSSDDFKHTDKLTALAYFARQIDPKYHRYRGYEEKISILDKEGMDMLKERIFELTKKCVNSHKRRMAEECYITPLSEVNLPE